MERGGGGGRIRIKGLRNAVANEAVVNLNYFVASELRKKWVVWGWGRLALEPGQPSKRKLRQASYRKNTLPQRLITSFEPARIVESLILGGWGRGSPGPLRATVLVGPYIGRHLGHARRERLGRGLGRRGHG